MSTTRAVTALAALIHDSQQRRSTAYGIAHDVDRAGMLMSPEAAAELERLRSALACDQVRDMLASAERENRELRAEVTRLVDDRQQWRARYYEESRTYWDAELPPGGVCCADCGQPVESERCPDHHPATLAARLRARVAELEAAAAPAILRLGPSEATRRVQESLRRATETEDRGESAAFTPRECGSRCPKHEHTCRRSPVHQPGICRDEKQKGTESCTWDPTATPVVPVGEMQRMSGDPLGDAEGSAT